MSNRKLKLKLPEIDIPVPEGLTAKQMRLVQMIVSGMAQGKAYLAAGFHAKDVGVACALANRVLKKPNVALYLSSYRAAVQRQMIQASVMSLTERRQILAEIGRVTRGNIGSLPKTSRAVQSVKITEKTMGKGDSAVTIRTIEIKVPDKIAAMRLDSQLAGELHTDPDSPPVLPTTTDAILDIMLRVRMRNQRSNDTGTHPTQPKTIEVTGTIATANDGG